MSESLGDAVLHLRTDDSQLDSGLNRARGKAESLAGDFTRIGGRMQNVGGRLSLALTTPIVALAAAAVPAAVESQQALAQVDSALASMGPVAGRTSEQLQGLASHLQDISLFDDDDIMKSVTANLLTFGNVAGESFDRAQLAAVNMSQRLDQDLQSSAIQVGKALNDPIKGITALSRVGVSFTAQQQEQIKAMARAGDAAGAQSIILGELERQFGGAAAAARDATPSAAMDQQWRTFQETIGGIVLVVLPPLTALLTDVLAGFNGLSPSVQTMILSGLGLVAALGPVLMILGTMATGIGALIPMFAGTAAGVGGVAAAGGAATGVMGGLAAMLGPVALAVGALAAAWLLFGDKIGPVLTELWGKVQAVLGPRLISLFNTVKSVLTGLWEGPFGTVLKTVIGYLGDFAAAYASVFGAVAIRVLSVLVTAIESGFRVIGDVLNFVGSILTGDFAGAWRSMRQLADHMVQGLLDVFESLAPGAIASVRALVAGVQHWLGGQLDAVWNWVEGKIETVKNAFFNLYDAVVGHSYIPDMVDEIGQHMRRLDGEMVQPATTAAEKTAAAMQALSSLMTELFPEAQRQTEFISKLAILDDAMARGRIRAGEYAAALTRLRTQYNDLERNGIMAAPIDLGPAPTVPEIMSQEQIDALGGASKAVANDSKESWQTAFRNSFVDGVKAALDGNLGSFLSSWWSRVADNALTNVLSGMADWFSGLLSGLFSGGRGSGGGGLGGAIGGLLSSVFSGGKALGGLIPTGSFGILGEQGPEPVISTPRGALVRPNSSLQSGSYRAPGPSISMPISIDATGADAAALERVRAELAAMRSELPGTIVRTVQDAGDRRMLSAGVWR